ncbi:MAG TPA: Mbeg1-like protein [Lachnospiraceae bacterium]|nr:Mbeg1-like protein [Lachnospiraceae bacterium]
MSDLSERELVMLSNYLYMKHSVTEGSIGDALAALSNDAGEIDPTKLTGIGGGMDTEDAMIVLNEMNAASEDFKSLQVMQSIDNRDIRGVCFVHPETGNATVVFRGTGGGYCAWKDNIIAQYQQETRIQKQAAEFVSQECGAYQQMTVAGHSKGGNLAQYVTVTCPKQISRCVSFDGQGFNRNFINSYRDDVAMARPKIKSISAHNDFVNILLLAIAGQRIFVENNSSGADAHSAVPLLIDNKFDENGNFTSIIEQNRELKVLEGLLADGVILLDELPEGTSEKVVNVLAAILAGVLSSELSTVQELAILKLRINELKTAVSATPSEGFTVDICAMMNAEEDMRIGTKRLKQAREDVVAANSQLNDETEAVSISKRILDKIAAKIEDEQFLLQQMCNAIQNITAIYVQKEGAIIDEINQ